MWIEAVKRRLLLLLMDGGGRALESLNELGAGLRPIRATMLAGRLSATSSCNTGDGGLLICHCSRQNDDVTRGSGDDE